MKAIMTGVALAALLAAAPAVAQTQPEPAQPQEMIQDQASCPEGATETATGEPCPDGSTATAPATEEEQPADAAEAPMEAPDATTTGSLPSDQDTEAAQSDEAQPESTDMTAEADRGKFIDEQEDSAVLASELIGLTVYNSADEALGDVNDILWKDDGAIDAVVVGVGGFLGIGEKAVAVAYEAVEVTTDENGDKKLVFDATSDELAAAPEFVTSAEKLAALQAEQPPAAPAPGGGMAPAPAAPEPAPAE